MMQIEVIEEKQTSYFQLNNGEVIELNHLQVEYDKIDLSCLETLMMLTPLLNKMVIHTLSFLIRR